MRDVQSHTRPPVAGSIDRHKHGADTIPRQQASITGQETCLTYSVGSAGFETKITMTTLEEEGNRKDSRRDLRLLGPPVVCLLPIIVRAVMLSKHNVV